ncbi:hypothetical protein TRVA0_063S00188 [Trichomonascus vanleenenianus]|uniref:Msb1p n=1 Tax=Trichomonascus vanleenenianus TaxID=2268995 RepID=UPI003EC9A9DB
MTGKREHKLRIQTPPVPAKEHKFEEIKSPKPKEDNAKGKGDTELRKPAKNYAQSYKNFFFTQEAFTQSVLPRPVLADLIMEVTKEIKARGVLAPYLLLPFRPESAPDELRSLISAIFPIGKSPLTGDDLLREIRLADVYSLAGLLKWCWCRLPGGIVSWKVYEMFKAQEAEAGFKEDSFLTVLPKLVDSAAHASIVFHFFDLVTSIATHGRRNGMGPRKLARLAGLWAFDIRKPDMNEPTSFADGLGAWSTAADATNHIFLAFLRLFQTRPPAPGEPLKPLGPLPRSLLPYLENNRYPPKPLSADRSRLVAVPMITLTVGKLSASPLVLLRRVAKTIRFDNPPLFHSEDDFNTLFFLFSDPESIEYKMSPESLRIVNDIINENPLITDHPIHIKDTPSLPYDVRAKTWSKFYNHAYVDPVYGEICRPLNNYIYDEYQMHSILKATVPSQERSSLPYPPDSPRLGRHSDGVDWEKFTSLAFNGQPVATPPQSRSKKMSADNLVTASISQVAIDDFFVWVWMCSLSEEQSEIRKATFGRSVVVELEVAPGEAGKRWVVIEEVLHPEPGPIKPKPKPMEPELDRYPTSRRRSADGTPKPPVEKKKTPRPTGRRKRKPKEEPKPTKKYDKHVHHHHSPYIYQTLDPMFIEALARRLQAKQGQQVSSQTQTQTTSSAQTDEEVDRLADAVADALAKISTDDGNTKGVQTAGDATDNDADDEGDGTIRGRPSVDREVEGSAFPTFHAIERPISFGEMQNQRLSESVTSPTYLQPRRFSDSEDEANDSIYLTPHLGSEETIQKAKGYDEASIVLPKSRHKYATGTPVGEVPLGHAKRRSVSTPMTGEPLSYSPSMSNTPRRPLRTMSSSLSQRSINKPLPGVKETSLKKAPSVASLNKPLPSVRRNMPDPVTSPITSPVESSAKPLPSHPSAETPGAWPSGNIQDAEVHQPRPQNKSLLLSPEHEKRIIADHNIDRTAGEEYGMVHEQYNQNDGVATDKLSTDPKLTPSKSAKVKRRPVGTAAITSQPSIPSIADPIPEYEHEGEEQVVRRSTYLQGPNPMQASDNTNEPAEQVDNQSCLGSVAKASHHEAPIEESTFEKRQMEPQQPWQKDQELHLSRGRSRTFDSTLYPPSFEGQWPSIEGSPQRNSQYSGGGGSRPMSPANSSQGYYYPPRNGPPVGRPSSFGSGYSRPEDIPPRFRAVTRGMSPSGSNRGPSPDFRGNRSMGYGPPYEYGPRMRNSRQMSPHTVHPGLPPSLRKNQSALRNNLDSFESPYFGREQQTPRLSPERNDLKGVGPVGPGGMYGPRYKRFGPPPPHGPPPRQDDDYYHGGNHLPPRDYYSRRGRPRAMSDLDRSSSSSLQGPPPPGYGPRGYSPSLRGPHPPLLRPSSPTSTYSNSPTGGELLPPPTAPALTNNRDESVSPKTEVPVPQNDERAASQNKAKVQPADVDEGQGFHLAQGVESLGRQNVSVHDRQITGQKSPDQLYFPPRSTPSRLGSRVSSVPSFKTPVDIANENGYGASASVSELSSMRRSSVGSKPLPLDPKWNEVKKNLEMMREKNGSSSIRALPLMVDSTEAVVEQGEPIVSPDEYYSAVVNKMRRPSINTGEHVRSIIVKDIYEEMSVNSEDGRTSYLPSGKIYAADDHFKTEHRHSFPKANQSHSSFSQENSSDTALQYPELKAGRPPPLSIQTGYGSSSSSLSSSVKRFTQPLSPSRDGLVYPPPQPHVFDPKNEHSLFRAGRAGLLDISNTASQAREEKKKNKKREKEKRNLALKRLSQPLLIPLNGGQTKAEDAKHTTLSPALYHSDGEDGVNSAPKVSRYSILGIMNAMKKKEEPVTVTIE